MQLCPWSHSPSSTRAPSFFQTKVIGTGEVLAARHDKARFFPLKAICDFGSTRIYGFGKSSQVNISEPMLVTVLSLSVSGCAQVPVTPSISVVLTYSANHRRLQSHKRLELLRRMLFKWDNDENGDSWMVLMTLLDRSIDSRLSRPTRAMLPRLLILLAAKPNTLNFERCLKGSDVSSIVWESWLPSR